MISERLTDFYHLLQKEGIEVINSSLFSSYLNELEALPFAEAVFTLGNEVRDLEFGSVDTLINKALSLVEEVYTKHKEVIEREDSTHLRAMYLIGLAHLRFYFCRRTGFSITQLDLDEGDNPMLDIESSVNHLRLGLYDLTKALDISKGIWHYAVIRSLNYAFDILDNYKVFNDNKPIDLDSVYVFYDQIPEGPLWEELVLQMRRIYKVQ